MKRIDSNSNSFYRMCKSLLTSSGIKDARKILIMGRKIVPEVLRQNSIHFHALIVSDPKDVELLNFPKSLDVFWFKRDLFDEIDEAGTHYPILIIDSPGLDVADLTAPPQDLEVVLAMANPLNVGAALRVCEAMNVRTVTLLSESANPYLPKVIRASSGSALKLKLQNGPSIKKLIDSESKFLTALHIHGESIIDFNWPQKTRLLVGEEGQGIPPELNVGSQVTIPIKSGMDSLNAVSAISMALFSYRTKFRI